MVRSLLLMGGIVLATSCVTHKTSPSSLGDLDSFFSSEVPADEPGLAVLIAKGDSILFTKGYGIADIQTREPITPSTLFNLGSISKTFVANAILILQQEGKLSVEDSLAKYFPYFKNQSIARRIRIKHLLTHTSGLPDNRRVSEDSVFYLTAKDSANWYPVTQADTLEFEPGEQFHYSNPAFNGLALIVEKVSGMKWQQFIQERIFLPAGMTSSTITDGPHPVSGVAHGYQPNGPHHTWYEDDYGEEPTFPAAGNGGVWSSVLELMEYSRALRKATFLSRETVKQSWKVFDPPNWTSPHPPSRGWSWEIGRTSTGLETVEHHGDQGGFVANYVMIPERELLMVILCNGRRDEEKYSEILMKVVESM